MRTDDGWSDVTICNISSRGLMLKGESSPAKGSYVEIWHRNVCVIGHVRWSHASRFGVRSQDRIDIPALLNSARSKPPAGIERRSGARAPTRGEVGPDVAAKAEANRAIAKVFEWLAISIASAVFAGALVTAVGTALEQPVQRARSALGTSQEPR